MEKKRPNPLHLEVHPEYVDGCFPCKMSTIRIHSTALSLANQGKGAAPDGQTDRQYVKEMFESRRSAGLPDPIPATKQAAALAPAAGPMAGKKYREINGGI